MTKSKDVKSVPKYDQARPNFGVKLEREILRRIKLVDAVPLAPRGEIFISRLT